jgi:hypothetical protein
MSDKLRAFSVILILVVFIVQTSFYDRTDEDDGRVIRMNVNYYDFLNENSILKGSPIESISNLEKIPKGEGSSELFADNNHYEIRFTARDGTTKTLSTWYTRKIARQNEWLAAIALLTPYDKLVFYHFDANRLFIGLEHRVNTNINGDAVLIVLVAPLMNAKYGGDGVGYKPTEFIFCDLPIKQDTKDLISHLSKQFNSTNRDAWANTRIPDILQSLGEDEKARIVSLRKTECDCNILFGELLSSWEKTGGDSNQKLNKETRATLISDINKTGTYIRSACGTDYLFREYDMLVEHQAKRGKPTFYIWPNSSTSPKRESIVMTLLPELAITVNTNKAVGLFALCADRCAVKLGPTNSSANCVATVDACNWQINAFRTTSTDTAFFRPINMADPTFSYREALLKNILMPGVFERHVIKAIIDEFCATGSKHYVKDYRQRISNLDEFGPIGDSTLTFMLDGTSGDSSFYQWRYNFETRKFIPVKIGECCALPYKNVINIVEFVNQCFDSTSCKTIDDDKVLILFGKNASGNWKSKAFYIENFKSNVRVPEFDYTTSLFGTTPQLNKCIKYLKTNKDGAFASGSTLSNYVSQNLALISSSIPIERELLQFLPFASAPNYNDWSSISTDSAFPPTFNQLSATNIRLLFRYSNGEVKWSTNSTAATNSTSFFKYNYIAFDDAWLCWLQLYDTGCKAIDITSPSSTTYSFVYIPSLSPLHLMGWKRSGANDRNKSNETKILNGDSLYLLMPKENIGNYLYDVKERNNATTAQEKDLFHSQIGNPQIKMADFRSEPNRIVLYHIKEELNSLERIVEYGGSVLWDSIKIERIDLANDWQTISTNYSKYNHYREVWLDTFLISTGPLVAYFGPEKMGLQRSPQGHEEVAMYLPNSKKERFRFQDWNKFETLCETEPNILIEFIQSDLDLTLFKFFESTVCNDWKTKKVWRANPLGLFDRPKPLL